MECKQIKALSQVFFVFAFAGIVACSRGGLYDGQDSFQEEAFSPKVSHTEPDTSLSLADTFDSTERLFFGAGDGYDELTIFSPSYRYTSDDADDTPGVDGQTFLQFKRYLIRHKEPLDLQRLTLQPQEKFDPFAGADCVLTLEGKLQKEDQCEGASSCKLYRVENIVTNQEGDTCGFPTIKSFVAKFDASLHEAEVVQPGTESWMSIKRINYFDTKSSAIRITSAADPFSSVIGTASANGYVFVGKKYNKKEISASFPDLVGTTPIRKEDLVGVSTADFFEKAQTRNVLLTATPSGIYKLNSEDKWEVLTLPTGLTAMPTGVKKVQAASGVGLAAFRFVFTDAGSEKNLLLVYKEASNKVEIVDHTSIALDQNSPVDAIPSGWAMMIVNESLWFWHPQLPKLAKRFDNTEKKWLLVSLTLPEMPEAEAFAKYIISPAGTGFVLTLK